MDVDVDVNTNSDGNYRDAANSLEPNHSSLQEQVEFQQKKNNDADVNSANEQRNDGDFFLGDYLTCAYSNPVEDG